MKFRYLADKLFLTCMVVYAINRWALRPLGETVPAFSRHHLNDLICVPFCLPGILLAARRIGLREHDDPPRAGEILLLVIIWSIWFEVIASSPGAGGAPMIRDPWDVACYIVGGLMAGTIWNWGYLGGRTQT